jgi:hypothetical protein
VALPISAGLPLKGKDRVLFDRGGGVGTHGRAYAIDQLSYGRNAAISQVLQFPL